MQSYFQDTEAENFTADESMKADMSLMFNADSHVTKLDLLAALPQRVVVDRLVSRYFNSNSPALRKIEFHLTTDLH